MVEAITTKRKKRAVLRKKRKDPAKRQDPAARNDDDDDDEEEEEKLGGLRILGIQVDHKLTWADHINSIERKVEAKMNSLRRLHQSTSGPVLYQMRKAYLTGVRSIISYGCPAWFLLGDNHMMKYHLTQALVDRLHSLQTQCLRMVAGAFSSTPGAVLQKELNIEPITVHLQRLATCQRVRALDGDDPGLMESLHNRFYSRHKSDKFDKQPYRVAYCYARAVASEIGIEYDHTTRTRNLKRPDFCGLDLMHRKTAITKYVQRQSTLFCAELWRDYCEQRQMSKSRADFNRTPVAVKGKWGKESLNIHKDLTHAQSSILIQCRTGHIGLNSYLSWRKCPDVVTKMCPCRTGEHTVGHLFYACPDLQEQRSQLPLKDFRGGKRTRNGMCTLEGLLTEGAAQASRWAINHFGIQQFTWTSNHADFASFKNMVYAHQGGF